MSDVSDKKYELVRLDLDEETHQPLYARLGAYATEKEALADLRDLAAASDLSAELFSIVRVVRPPFKTAVATRQVVKFEGFQTGRRRPRAQAPIKEGPSDA